MNPELLQTLQRQLAGSNAAARKDWAEQIISQQLDLHSFLSLFNAEQKTAQRFMWFIGDLVDLQPDVVKPCIPFLFSLRDEMPFPGMRRSVAKWLWRTNVPPEIEAEAIPQLFSWLTESTSAVACKHYSAKALHSLALEGRVELAQLKSAVDSQTSSSNRAHRGRMQKLLRQLEDLRV